MEVSLDELKEVKKLTLTCQRIDKTIINNIDNQIMNFESKVNKTKFKKLKEKKGRKISKHEKRKRGIIPEWLPIKPENNDHKPD